MRLVSILGAALIGCGGSTPAPTAAPPTPASRNDESPRAVRDDVCLLDHCDTRQVATPDIIKQTDEGVELDFASNVRVEDARHVIFHCQTFQGHNNPEAAGLVCPVDLGALKIDVSEGPAGVSFMLRLGDPSKRALLRQWYEEHFR